MDQLRAMASLTREGVDAARAHLPVDAVLQLAQRDVVHTTDADVEVLADAMRGALDVVSVRPEAFVSVLRMGRAFDLATIGSDATLAPDALGSLTLGVARTSEPAALHRFGGWERWATISCRAAITHVHETQADPTALAERLRELAESRQVPRSVVLRFVEDAEQRAMALRARFEGRFIVGATDTFERELSELRAARERAARWSERREPFSGAGPEIDELREVGALEFAADELHTRFLLVATRAAILAARDKDHANERIAAERDPCVGDPLRLVDGDIAPSAAGRSCLDALRAASGRAGGWFQPRFYEPSDLGKQVVQLHIRACVPQARACFLRELASNPDAAGRIVAQIVVDDTMPHEVTLEESGLLSARFQQCLLEAIETCPIRPTQRKGVAIVRYPFTFTQR
ncbi:MAG: hypothetical protein R3B99_27455 [Polyangiales bacterium]